MKGKALIVLCILSSLLCGIVCTGWISGTKVMTALSWDRAGRLCQLAVLSGGFAIRQISYTGPQLQQRPEIKLHPLMALGVDDEILNSQDPRFGHVDADWRIGRLRYWKLTLVELPDIDGYVLQNRMTGYQCLSVPFGVPFVLTVVFPAMLLLVRLAKESRSKDGKKTLRLAKSMLFMLLLPAIAGMLLILSTVQLLVWIT